MQCSLLRRVQEEQHAWGWPWVGPVNIFKKRWPVKNMKRDWSAQATFAHRARWRSMHVDTHVIPNRPHTWILGYSRFKESTQVDTRPCLHIRVGHWYIALLRYLTNLLIPMPQWYHVLDVHGYFLDHHVTFTFLFVILVICSVENLRNFGDWTNMSSIDYGVLQMFSKDF